MKFAYLILAHDNFKVLEKLVGMLDDPRNDIYIHYDVKLKDLPGIRAESSNLFILSDRVDVRWGTVSQIEALYKLYHASYGKERYDFFIVISGTHLPLKNQDYIHEYLSKYQGNSIIRKWNYSDGEIAFKLKRYHLFIDNFQSPNKGHRAVVQKIWTASMFIQRHLGISRHRNQTFVKADEWAIISSGHLEHMLGEEDIITKKYKHTFCSDEFYLASELLAYDPEHVIDDQNLLFMHFDADRPQVIGKEEYLELVNSPYLFARKFSDKTI